LRRARRTRRAPRYATLDAELTEFSNAPHDIDNTIDPSGDRTPTEVVLRHATAFVAKVCMLN
jgi:hypothetical protein